MHVVTLEWIDAPDQKVPKIFRPASKRPWVARIAGFDSKFGFAREFVRGMVDYRDSNSTGSRGVTLTFLVEEAVPYEVCSWPSRNRQDRRYCQWVAGEERVLARGEVETWLRAKLG